GRRRVHRALAEFTCVVYTAVGGRVDLNDVQACGTAPDAGARCTFAARPAGCTASILPALAVEGHGEHACQGRLARTARTTQEIAGRHTTTRDGVPERVGDMRLHRNRREVTRAVLSSECDCHETSGKVRGAAQTAPRQREPDGAMHSSGSAAIRSRRHFSTTSRRSEPANQGRSPRDYPGPDGATKDTTYRCYLRGPDGVGGLAPSGTRGTEKCSRSIPCSQSCMSLTRDPCAGYQHLPGALRPTAQPARHEVRRRQRLLLPARRPDASPPVSWLRST